MDHGPFNAVELLQQIGSHAFVSRHILRDTFSSDERPIEEWEEFAPFAEQSKLNREIVAEKKAIEQVVVAEAQGHARQDADRRRRTGAHPGVGRRLVPQGPRRSQRRHRGRFGSGDQRRIRRRAQGRKARKRAGAPRRRPGPAVSPCFQAG